MPTDYTSVIDMAIYLPATAIAAVAVLWIGLTIGYLRKGDRPYAVGLAGS